MKTQEDFRQDVMETAADWCDRLGELSAEERAELKAWLEASPENARAFAAVRRTMLDVALLDAATQVQPNLETARSTRMPSPFTRFWRAMSSHSAWLAGVGALAAACVALLLTVNNTSTPQDQPTARVLVTAIGQRADFTLADKSKVYLNAESRINVQYSRSARALALTRGEAIFKVTKDAARPFQVSVRSAKVTAVGTVFGVDLVDNAVQVRVFEGTVRVAAAGMKPRSITRGQWINMDPERGTSSGDFTTGKYQTWQTDWLEADNMPLAYVVTKLNRYTNAKITIKDRHLSNVALNGRFRLSNTDTTLSMISALLDVNVERQKNEIVLVPRHK